MLKFTENLFNRLMEEHSFLEIIEDAKKLSNKKIVNFSKDMFGTDEETWENLTEVPIIDSLKMDSLIPKEIPLEEKENVLGSINFFVSQQLGDNEAVTIPYEYLKNITPSMPENDIIIYSRTEIMNEIRCLLEDDYDLKTLEILRKEIMYYIAKIITHERMHVNSIYRTQDDGEQKSIYGAIGNYNKEDNEVKFDFYEEQNEILTDTVALMIQRYKEGDSFEKCLYKIIKSRNGKNPYKNYDDRITVLIMILFPRELTEWAMLGTQESKYNNLLEQKIEEVFGKNPENVKNIEQVVGEYFQSMDKSELSEKLLQMMGVKNIENNQEKETTNLDKEIER